MPHTMPRKETFPDLRSIREQRDGLLVDYAAQVGVAEGTLSRIERGHFTRLDVRTALGIARVYGVPVESLAKEAA